MNKTIKIGVSNKKWVFLQEYEQCSCTFLALKAKELPNHCPIHQNPVRKTTKLPGKGFQHAQFGLAEV